MGIDGLTFVPKKWLVFTNLGKGLSQKVGFFFILVPILRAGFLTKCWLFQTRNQLLSLFTAFLAVGFITVLLKCCLKGRFLTKKTP